MPELPEVEAIKLQLGKYLTGHKIVSVKVNYQKTFRGSEKRVIGAKVSGTRRFGKVIVIDLTNGYSLLTHLKMTGQFIYRGPNLSNPGELSKKVTGGVPGKHTHVIFKLDRGGVFYFNDVRKFGWIRVEKSSEIEKETFISKLGPEPFRGLTLEKFGEILSKSGRQIKVVLMDQTIIGGIGNIYANDALWEAGINPGRAAKSLKPMETQKLHDAILKVLKEGIKYGGASEQAFVTPDGTEGNYQDYTLAYGREGKPCGRCHRAKIEKIFLGGRGTYFCPNCQK